MNVIYVDAALNRQIVFFLTLNAAQRQVELLLSHLCYDVVFKLLKQIQMLMLIFKMLELLNDRNLEK